MSVYTISDLHLSLSDPNKSMDIFKGWENYIQRIHDNWIKNVMPEDTVIIVGDTSWVMKLEDTKKDFEFLHSLPGTKIIIKGNHDFWWSGITKINNFLKENNFSSIIPLLNDYIPCENLCICGSRGWILNSQKDADKKILLREIGRLRTSIKKADNCGNLEKIVFIHYPPIFLNTSNHQILDVLGESNIKKCYYGHVHGSGSCKNIVEGLYSNIYFKLVSCDYINFTPILVN
jgi:predicted phosphohydrolase